MPGVSEKTIWKSSPLTMPRMRWRVVCALEVMMESFSPTNAFISVDFPTLGFPMILTKPDLCMKCGLLGSKVKINSRKFLMFAKVTRLNRIAYGEITGDISGCRRSFLRKSRADGRIESIFMCRHRTKSAGTKHIKSVSFTLVFRNLENVVRYIYYMLYISII